MRVGRSQRGAVLDDDGDAFPVCFVLVVEVVVEVEQPVLDRDASLAGLVGEVEVDRRAGPREPKLPIPTGSAYLATTSSDARDGLCT